jgi:hypothetical protein
LHSNGSQVQPRSESEITAPASIESLPCNTLASLSECLERSNLAIAVQSHPLALVKALSDISDRTRG